jgi:hypothetical protein
VLFLEEHARWLLVTHTVVAVALVASSTHLVVWMRGYLRGSYARHRSVRKFSYITLSLFAAAFLLGNIVYPTYKVRVRMEYLESGTAIERAVNDRAEQRADTRERYERARALREGASVDEATSIEIESERPDSIDAAHGAAKIARWFDVKEHWAALGLILSAACALVVTFWDPRKEGRQIAIMVFGLALGASATTWLAAIVGLLTTSYRAVGG